MAGSFTLDSVQIEASTYFGIDASTAQSIYSGGAVTFVYFTPDPAALSAVGISANSVPLIVSLPGSGSEMVTLGTSERKQCLEQIPQGIGYGPTQDGTSATPSAVWPTFVVCPQLPSPAGGWTGSNPDSGARNNGAFYQIITACIYKMFQLFPQIDRTRVYFSGHSGGAGFVTDYLYANQLWPRIFPIRPAACIVMSGVISGSGMRQNLPEMTKGEVTTTQTFPRVSRIIAAAGIPIWWFQSVNDSINPGAYGPVHQNLQYFTPPSLGINITAGISAGNYKIGKRRNKVGPDGSVRGVDECYRFTEYTGGSAPTHVNVWKLTLSDNQTIGTPVMTPSMVLFDWLLKQKSPTPYLNDNRATSLMYSGAGGSGGGSPPLPPNTIFKYSNRRRRY